MSLYSLADGLFEEIDRARSLHQTTTRGTWWSGQQHPLESVTVREEPNWPPHRGRGDTNSEVPPWFHGRKRRDSSWDEVADNVDHTPTIELLAGCLQEIQQVGASLDYIDLGVQLRVYIISNLVDPTGLQCRNAVGASN